MCIRDRVITLQFRRCVEMQCYIGQFYTVVIIVTTGGECQGCNKHAGKNNRLTRITYPQVRLRRKLKLLLPMHLLQKLRHRLLKLLLLQQSNSLCRQVRLWGKTINGKVQTDAAFL